MTVGKKLADFPNQKIVGAHYHLQKSVVRRVVMWYIWPKLPDHGLL